MTRRDMRSEPAVKYPPRLHRYLLSSLKNRAVTLVLHAVVPFSSFSTIPPSLRLSLSTVHILPISPLPPVAPLAACAAAWGVAFVDPSDPTDCGIALNITVLNSGGIAGPIPPSIGSLIGLTHIDLDNNALTGSIPPTISHLTRLLHLDLSYNQLSGSIPTAIDGLLSITELNFRYNRMTGSIPAVIGNLTTLNDLYLSSNQLKGSLPAEIGNLHQLSTLDVISGNHLSGVVPPVLGGIPLGTLSIYESNLTCPTGGSCQLKQDPMSAFCLECPDFCASCTPSPGSPPPPARSPFPAPMFPPPRVPRSPPAPPAALPPLVFPPSPPPPSPSSPPPRITLSPPIPTTSPPPEISLPPPALPSQPSPSTNPFLTPPPLPSPLPSSPSVPPTSSSSSSSSSGGGVSVAVVAGVAAAAVCVVLVLLVLGFCWWRSKKKKQHVPSGPSQASSQPFLDPHATAGQGEGAMVAAKPSLEATNSSGSDSKHNSSAAPYQPVTPLGSTDAPPLFHQFALRELEAATQCWSPDCKIGSGAFGDVYRGLCPGNASVVWAVKRARIISADFRREVDQMATKHHPNLVRLLGSCNDVDAASQLPQQILVYEFMGQGDLAKRMRTDVSYLLLVPAMACLLRHRFSPLTTSPLLRSPSPPTSPRPTVNACVTGQASASSTSPSLAAINPSGFKLCHATCPPLAPHRGFLTSHRFPLSSHCLPPLSPSLFPPIHPVLFPGSRRGSFGVVMLEVVLGRGPVVLLGTECINIKDWAAPLLAADNLTPLVDPSLQAQPPDALASTLSQEQQERLTRALTELGLACTHVPTASRPSMASLISSLSSLKSEYFGTREGARDGSGGLQGYGGVGAVAGAGVGGGVQARVIHEEDEEDGALELSGGIGARAGGVGAGAGTGGLAGAAGEAHAKQKGDGGGMGGDVGLQESAEEVDRAFMEGLKEQGRTLDEELSILNHMLVMSAVQHSGMHLSSSSALPSSQDHAQRIVEVSELSPDAGFE
ncbi:unnamed protein product [Closterium sp. Naga37s-1]|nr:unnamed protein product [Closterium sp. Naga37s-1]